MTVVAVAAAEPPAPVEQHAPDCDGHCPRWLAADAPTCADYPCRCAETKANAPQWRKDLGNVQCWWRKRTGGIASRCPCWGRAKDGMPGDCCSHHSANPLYVWEGEFTVNPDLQLEAAAEVPEEPDTPRPPDADRVDWGDVPWEDERPQRKPYVRRWKPEELACPCQPGSLPKGVHCLTCCLTFANEMAWGMHRRDGECRFPFGVLDVDTGAALLWQDGLGVWRMHWHTEPGCCETSRMLG
jgi:hypothetical protein